MGKVKTVYVCQQCGATSPKWSGQCANCQAWNSMAEEIQAVSKSSLVGGGRRATVARAVRLNELLGEAKKVKERLVSGSSEFDRVLGGGIVPGSVVLIAGEPGMGKSTLLTQLALKIGKSRSVLYVCGEESPNQVAMRIKRLLGIANDQLPNSKVLLAAITDVDQVVATAEAEQPQVLIVDSIQTLTTSDLSGMSGSVGQVRESANRLVRLAKETGIAVFLVGHVTKDGTVAGPKVLEHMVDVVVELTGERSGIYRLLRSLKNRFGAVDEVGVMQMEETGLADVPNPSGVFLDEAQAGAAGRVVVVAMEGVRPVLVEIQALATKTSLAQPRRVAQGVPLPKVQVMLAVLQKWCRLPCYNYDVFVSVVGGLKLVEPGVDLGIALAVASSILGKGLPKETVVVGEVGLLGEVRRVVRLEKRLKEAKKLGYGRSVAPPAVKHITQAVKELR